MKKLSYGQQGFGVIEVLVPVVLIGALIGAGWYVWQSRQDNTEVTDNTVSSQTKEQTPISEQAKQELALFTTDTGVSFSYPKEYKLTHNSWDTFQKANIPASRGYMESTQLIVESKEYPNVFACIDFSSDANNDKELPIINPVKLDNFTPVSDKQLELYSHTNDGGYNLSLGENLANITDNKGYFVAIWVSLNCHERTSQYLDQVEKPYANLDVIAEAKKILETVSVQ